MAIKGILFGNDGTLVGTYQLILESLRYSTRAVLGTMIPDEQPTAKVEQTAPIGLPSAP